MLQTNVVFHASEQAGKASNQDRYAFYSNDEKSTAFIVVADGVGGSSDGEKAAELIVEQSKLFWQKLSDYEDKEQFLIDFAASSDQALADYNQNEHSVASTLVAILIVEDTVVSIHAGDSRVMQLNDDSLIKQTDDHSLAFAKYKLGEISHEEIATHPTQNQLLNCLTGKNEYQTDIRHWQVAEGHRFVICSDGFWEIFDTEAIIQLIENDNRDFIFANTIDQELQRRPKHDNTTAVIIDIQGTQQATIAAVETNSGSVVDSSNDSNVTTTDTPAAKNNNARYLLIIAALVALFYAYSIISKDPSSQADVSDNTEVSTTEIIEPQPKQKSQSENKGVDSANTELNDVAEVDTQQASTKELENEQQEVQNPKVEDAVAEEATVVKPKTDEPKKKTPPMQAVSADEEVIKAAAEEKNKDKTGKVDNSTLANKGLASPTEITVEVKQGQTAEDALLDHLKELELIDEHSKLTVKKQQKDEYANITTSQLIVNNVPVFGAVIKYQIVNGNLEVLSGKTSKLDNIADKPTHEFQQCFDKYAEASLKDGSKVELLGAEPILYIDPASSGYFWQVNVSTTTNEKNSHTTIHLLDKSCDVLRSLPIMVSA